MNIFLNKQSYKNKKETLEQKQTFLQAKSVNFFILLEVSRPVLIKLIKNLTMTTELKAYKQIF